MSSETIRLFLALELPAKLCNHLSQTISDLQTASSQRPNGNINSAIKWVRPENMHLTLKFFGETDPKLVGDITQAVDVTLGSSRFNNEYSLLSSKLGAFPNLDRAKVLWADLVGDDIECLELFASSLDEEFGSAGFECEKKRFRPHLTIGRIRQKSDVTELRKIVESYSYVPFDVRFSQLELIQSELRPEGPKYTTLANWSLGVERFGE